MRIVTASEMKQAEQAAVREGGSFLQLMENAGAACAKLIVNRFGIKDTPKRVAVVCGKGKNGGDGFVVARKLCEAGCAVTVVMTVEAKTEVAASVPAARTAVAIFAATQSEGDEGEMFRRLALLPVRFVCGFDPEFQAEQNFREQDILVDALFGTGFRGEPDAQTAALIQAMNASAAKRISVDLPSGLECDSGAASGLCVRADVTIAVAAFKPVHVCQPAVQNCGEVLLADIGLKDGHYSQSDPQGLYAYHKADLNSFFKPRDPLSHKGNYGHVLSVCGSRNMQGAAVLAANAAVHSGVGLITAAFPEAAYNAIAPKLTEPLLLPLPSTAEGTLAAVALPKLWEAIEKADAVLLGCGLGLNADTVEIVRDIVLNCPKPVILDADGINAICGHIDILSAAKAERVLTPHPGEMARLTGKPPSAALRERLAAAREFAEVHGAALVLKGANTLVAEAGTRRVYVNTTGNAGMATGGSGDLLAGILLSFLGQGMSPGDAARCAVYLHGAAGDAAAERLSQRGLTPTACLQELPRLFSVFE